jgi:glutathione synthase/RimK-type ligase-like ATP-grasp enzyme
MKVAILFDETEKIHSANWSLPWLAYCKQNNIDYIIINPYQNEVITILMEFDIILWHYSNYSFKDMLMAKNILNTMEYHRKKVFPSFNDAWHFDDKLAETYLLESINAPIPKSYYFYDIESVETAFSNLSFPIIAKLRNGSGSHNVKMVMSKEELRSYSIKMFGSGISSAPSLIYKASSNIRSSKSLKTFINRAKRIPEFLRSLANAKKFNVERGYVYLQEFIPNEGFDLKVVVVGNKLSFIGRNIREGEFRASGGGDLFYDRNRITKDVIESAFKTSDLLGFQCMGYDYVVNKQTGKGIIIEISYGFSHEALLAAGGYFDRDGNWFDEPLNAPNEILKNIFNANTKQN